MNFSKVFANIRKSSARSAWKRGVKLYAFDLLEELKDNYHGKDIPSRAMLRKALLNGADDWSAYSWGGCSFIYDPQIAERLCNPSELKKTKGGELRPNSREEWLDTQARALSQAARLILNNSGLK